MTASTLLIVTATAASLLTAAAQDRRYPLETPEGLRLHNVTAEPAALEGQRAAPHDLQGDAGARRADDARGAGAARGSRRDRGPRLLERRHRGGDRRCPPPREPRGARGFVGIAFRLQNDLKTYDAFYLRPTNGRADDQERRNHSVQYIAHPDWPWFRLRKETPAKYESYVDLVPGAWTKIKIEVRGDRARLYVHGQEQPTLIVNDVKSGAQARGAVALRIGPGTVAHFRNLSVEPLP